MLAVNWWKQVVKWWVRKPLVPVGMILTSVLELESSLTLKLWLEEILTTTEINLIGLPNGTTKGMVSVFVILWCEVIIHSSTEDKFIFTGF